MDRGPSLRPFGYALVLTVSFAGVSVTTFYALEKALALVIGPDFDSRMDPVETDAALTWLTVSSLLFLIGCAWLLAYLERTTRTLEKAASERLQAEQRALLGALGASVLHDCNNLLSVVEGNVLLLERSASMLGPDGRACLTELEQSLMRLSGLMSTYLKYTASPQRPSPCDLCSMLEECVKLMGQHPSVRSCRLRTVLAGSAPIEGNAPMLWSALSNLLVNAAQASGANGTVEVRLSQTGDGPVVEVHDNGPGVPPAQRRRIFEPFYSNKRDGHGLGLLAVQRCMGAHGGHVDVTDSPLGGACFRLHFPAPPPDAAAASDAAPALGTA